MTGSTLWFPIQLSQPRWAHQLSIVRSFTAMHSCKVLNGISSPDSCSFLTFINRFARPPDLVSHQPSAYHEGFPFVNRYASAGLPCRRSWNEASPGFGSDLYAALICCHQCHMQWQVCIQLWPGDFGQCFLHHANFLHQHQIVVLHNRNRLHQHTYHIEL